MFRQTVIILIVLSFISMASGQSSIISGHIYDEITKKPISAANIIVGNNGTTTDEFGGFTLQTNEQSPIKIIRIGYETGTINFTTNIINVYLKPTTINSSIVEVYATRVIPGITPVAYSNLSQKEINSHYSVEDVPMILSSQTGTHAYSESGNGTGYSYVSIRGFDQSRIAVMLDNVPLNDNESHQVYWVDHGDILSDATDVEIQRGIGNSLYGATAFGGSINVQTKIASPIEKFTISGLLGSYDTYRGRIQYSSGNRFGEQLSLNARISSIKSDGYRDDSNSEQYALNIGIEQHNNKLTNQFRALIGKEFSNLQWDGISADMLSDRKLRTSKLDWTIPFTDDFFQQIYSLNTLYRINSQIIFKNVAYLVKGSGFYEVNKFDQDYYSYNLDINSEFSDEEEQELSTDFLRRKWIQNKYFGIVPTLTFNNNKIRTDFGFETRIYSGDHFGEVIDAVDPILATKLPNKYRYYDYLGKKKSFTVFSHTIYTFPFGLHIIGDLQLQKHSWSLEQEAIVHAQGHELKADWLFINPRFGFSYSVSNNISFFGNYGTAEKEPADNQIIEADDVWAEPKEAATEKIFDKEIGINLLFNNKYLKINLYRIDYLNEILSDIYNFPKGEFDITSADKTIHEGIELEGGWEINNNITLRFNSAISKNYYKSGEFANNSITNVPGLLSNFTLDYSPTSNFGLFLHGKYVGKQFIDNLNSENLAISSYLLTNISARYQINNIKITTRINNLFDTLYATYGSKYGDSAIGYYWPGATRNLSVALDVQL